MSWEINQQLIQFLFLLHLRNGKCFSEAECKTVTQWWAAHGILLGLRTAQSYSSKVMHG